MYGLLYVTTLHPEYLHVLEKDKKKEDAAKQAQKEKLKKLGVEELGVEESKKAAEWIESFEYGKGKSDKLDPKTVSYLALEKEAFEKQIKKAKKQLKEEKEKLKAAEK